jgi:hypothetical protein
MLVDETHAPEREREHVSKLRTGRRSAGEFGFETRP